MISTQHGSAIAIGAGWRQRVTVIAAVPAFPAGCALLAHIRTRRTDAVALATLSTANGGIVRVDDASIDLVLSAVQTLGLAAGTVDLDVMRTDLAEPAYLGFALRIPVIQPVTRP